MGKPPEQNGRKSKSDSYQLYQSLAVLTSGNLSWWAKEVIFLVFFFFSKGIHRLVVFSSLTYFELVKNSLQKLSVFINYKYLTHRKLPSYFHFSGWAQPFEQECLFFCDTAPGDTGKAGLF